jgi:hypothetical protein
MSGTCVNGERPVDRLTEEAERHGVAGIPTERSRRHHRPRKPPDDRAALGASEAGDVGLEPQARNLGGRIEPVLPATGELVVTGVSVATATRFLIARIANQGERASSLVPRVVDRVEVFKTKRAMADTWVTYSPDLAQWK